MNKLILIVFCIQTSIVNAESDTWVRINKPSAIVKQQLASKAIEYDSFLWVNKSDVQNINRNHLSNMDEFSVPFEMIVSDIHLDLIHSLPQNNPWFDDLSSAENDFHLIQFKGPVKSEWLSEVSELGIKLIKPIAPFSYIVWANQQSIQKTKNLQSIRWSGYFYSAFKLQPDFRQFDTSELNTMALVYEANQSVVLTHIKSLGAKSIYSRKINENFTALTFKIPGNNYAAILEEEGILTVQRVGLDGGSRGEMSHQSIVGNYDENNDVFPDYFSWLNNTGLDGTGVVVGVVDGGIYQNHPDLAGNIVDCIGPGPSCGDDVDGHGSHVAGAIAGTGTSGVTDQNGFLRGQGVAPNAKVIEQLYGPLLGGGPNDGGMIAGGMLSIFKDSILSGAMLTNNSWGPTGTPQGYDIPTMEVDIISRDANPDKPGNQPVLAVWSIMNGGGDGGFSCSPSSLGSPDEAKNLFAVGSTSLQNNNLSQVSNIFNISQNSAHGPACDGRLVPHIVAPGCNTDGPASATGYGTMCGTSMASPVVSGSVSLFWQQYQNIHGINPSPALIKATFTAIAQNLQGNNDADGSVMSNAPNRQQGWGRLDLDAVINPGNKVWYFDQENIFSKTGTSWEQKLYPYNNSKPMRLMLVWTDAAGAGIGGSTPALVNDLDLTVLAEGNAFKGNVFGNDSFSEIGGDPDTLNNMEAIFLKPDQHNGNAIDISVVSANLVADALNPYDPKDSPAQDFALVCYNCVDSPDQGLNFIFKNGFEFIPVIDPIFKNGFEQ